MPTPSSLTHVPTHQTMANPSNPAAPPMVMPNTGSLSPMKIPGLVNINPERRSTEPAWGMHGSPVAPQGVAPMATDGSVSSGSMHPGSGATTGGAFPGGGGPFQGTTGGGTTGAAPGTGPRLEPLVIPQFQPVFNPQLASPIFEGIPLTNPGTVEIDFEIPRGIMGPFVSLGMYIMHAVPATDLLAGDHPMVWTDPDCGVISDPTPNPTAPPDFIGAREGDLFTYSLQLAGDQQYIFQHGHLNNNLRTIPLPVQVPAGAQGRLTLVRQTCSRYLPTSTVYVLAGLFGRLFHTVTTPFPLSSCRNPVRTASYTTASVSVPAPVTAIGTLSPGPTVPIEVTEHFPTVFSHFTTAGDDHLFIRFSWNVGFMMTDFVPVKVFQYATAGGWLPAFILSSGNTRFNVEWANPSVVAGQLAAHGSASIEGASYGF